MQQLALVMVTGTTLALLIADMRAYPEDSWPATPCSHAAPSSSGHSNRQGVSAP